MAIFGFSVSHPSPSCFQEWYYRCERSQIHRITTGRWNDPAHMFFTAAGGIWSSTLRYNAMQQVLSSKGGSMDKIGIYDSNQQLKFICEDLQAVQTVVTLVEDHPVYSDEHEMLIVVRRALEPIIGDLKKIIDSIDGALKEESNDNNQSPKESEKLTIEQWFIQNGGLQYAGRYFFASNLESDLSFVGERLEKFRKNPAQVGE